MAVVNSGTVKNLSVVQCLYWLGGAVTNPSTSRGKPAGVEGGMSVECMDVGPVVLLRHRQDIVHQEHSTRWTLSHNVDRHCYGYGGRSDRSGGASVCGGSTNPGGHGNPYHKGHTPKREHQLLEAEQPQVCLVQQNGVGALGEACVDPLHPLTVEENRVANVLREALNVRVRKSLNPLPGSSPRAKLCDCLEKGRNKGSLGGDSKRDMDQLVIRHNQPDEELQSPSNKDRGKRDLPSCFKELSVGDVAEDVVSPTWVNWHLPLAPLQDLPEIYHMLMIWRQQQLFVRGESLSATTHSCPHFQIAAITVVIAAPSRRTCPRGAANSPNATQGKYPDIPPRAARLSHHLSAR
eukprot:5558252-Amphidinium_carterae.7